MDDNLRKLYDNVSKEYDLPDFDTFKTDMQDGTKLRRLYDNVGQTFDLPDYETFVADMGLGKKKVPTEPSVENFQPVTKEEESFLAPSSVSGSKPKTEPEKRQTSVAGDLLRTLKSTSLKALGGITAIPELGDKTIDRLVAYPIAKAMMPDADEETIKLAIEGMDSASMGSSNLEGLASLGSGAQDKLSKVAARTDARMKQIEGGIIENFRQGNTGAAFEQLARGVVGTIPYLAEVAITAGGGAPAVLGSIGATAASQQYGEIKGREDLSEGKKVLNSWLYGGFEAAGELVTAGILNRTLRALKGTAPSKQVVDNLAKSLAKKFGLVAGQGGEEAASEMATQIGQNLTAIWTGENPDVGVFDGVLDAGLIGFVPGAGMGSVQAAVSGRAVATKKDIDAINKSHEAQATIIEQIEDAEAPAAKEILERELAAEKDKEYEVIDKNIEIAQSLSEEQLTEVGKLQAARTELDAKLVSNEVTKEERSTIEAMAENIDEQIEAIKTTPETPSGASGVESVSEVKPKSDTQVPLEANVPIPTQGIIETPTENTGEVVPVEEKVAKIAPEEVEAKPEELPPFTPAEVINRDYRVIKEKIGEKKALKYFKQVDRLINPNSNTIVEYRPEGVVTKEGDKYIFNALSDMDMKEWRISFKTDVSDQFATRAETPQVDAGIQAGDKTPQITSPDAVNKGIQAIPLRGRLKKSNFEGMNNSPLNKLDQDNAAALTRLNEYPSHFVGVTEVIGAGAEKITGITPKGAAQISKVSEYALELNFLNPSTKESSSQVMHFNTQEALDAAVDKIYEFTGRAVQKPGDFTGREREVKVERSPKDLARENLRAKWENLKNIGVAYDPRSQAEAQVEFTKALLEYIKQEVLDTAAKIKAEVKDIFGHDLSDADAEYLLAKSKGDEVPPAEPPVVEQTEQSEGEERTILRRVIESAEIDQEVKNDLLEQGIEYIPRGRKFTQPEAKALIDVYASVEGGIDKLFSAVRDMANGIAPDTRTVLNVYVAEQYSKQLEAATDTKTREQARRKVADAFMFGAELATTYGQAVEAQKKWQEILARDPEAIITIKKRRQTENNKEALKEMAGDLKASREFLEENIANNEEFKKLVEERVSEEIDKIANKKYGKIDKKKIDDFFKGLEIPTDKLFDAAIGLPVAVYNGSLQIIKRAVLAGADLINAINQAVDYINQWYKDKYDSGEIPSPDWNKDDYVAQMTERLKPLTKKVKKVRYKLPKKAEENIVDKLYDKMASATKPQLRRLVREYVATLEEEGAVSSERFRDLFAQAIGLEVLSQQDEQVIRLAGQSINHARKKAETLMDAYNEFLKESGMETPDKDKLATLEADIKQKKKAANKARFAAQKAAQQLDKLLQEEIELGQTISTLIQGNLLTPISLASNIIGNITFIPVRGVKTMIASALDNMVYGLAKAYAPMLKKIDPQKHPRLARMAEGLPTPQRIYRNFAALQGFGIGFARGGKEGAVQLITGQLADDIYRREMARGLEPVKAAMRLRDQLTGKEQARFDKILSDFLEAMPAGYMAEAFFRGLNFGDKPFRRAAETARLYEIAQIKGLRGKAREAFLANPDAETLDEMRKAGEVSVYQQDSFVSDLMKYVQQKLNKVGATNDHKRRAIVAKTLGHLAKATTIPFVKTPVNLIAEAFDYAIPVVTAARGVYAMKNGQRRKATELFAKAIVGQMMVSLAIYLLKNGLLTPPSDDDDKIRQAQYEGKRGYSFNPDAIWRSVTKGDTEWKDGDRVWSYQRLGVPSMILMGVAKAYQSVPQDKMSELSYFERNISMLPSIVSGSLDQSFLTGVSTALSAFMEGEAKFNDWMINTTKAMSAVIYPNTLAQISQTFFSDNYIREVRDMYSEEERLKRRMTNTFKDRMFMGGDLPTKVTIWGEDVKRVPEGRSWPYMFFDVTKGTKYQKTTFGVKMYEMYEKYRLVDEEDAKNIIPSLPSATSDVGWDKRNMTAEEVNELQKKVGTMRRMYVERFLSSEEWIEMSDEERIDNLQKIYRDCSTRVKSEMFMLDITKSSEQWPFLYENDFIPVPTSSVTIKGKRVEGERARDFYDQVQRYFVENIYGMPTGKVPEEEREEWKKEVDKAWSSAKRDVISEWKEQIED